MKQLLNRIFIAADAVCSSIVRRPCGNENNVVIVFQQVFGDAVILQSALDAYAKRYSKEKGFSLKLLARPSVASFMKDVLELPEDLEIETLDFKRFVEDYGYYRETVKKYRNQIGLLIVPGTSLSAEIFATASNAGRKVGLVRSMPVTLLQPSGIFSRLAYTDTVVPEKDMMMLQRHRQLLHYLGAKAHRAELPRLQKKDNIIPEERYCVLCPGSSLAEKCWPIERYAQVADYIITAYQMDIHLCGGADEGKYEKMILSLSQYPERIISHIGKTSFSDWSAIVQHASLVLGNDSATMHLAAAARRPAICIAGVYDKFQFFPYKVDYLAEEDRLPVSVIKEKKCQWCRTIGYYSGYGNPECKKRIEQGLCTSCIDDITVEEVLALIDSELSADKIG